MQELNLTTVQLIILIVILLVLLMKLWSRKSYFQLDTELLEEQEDNYTIQEYQARYGAYIQSQGRYYN